MSLLRHHQLLMSTRTSSASVVVASSLTPSSGSFVTSASIAKPAGTSSGDLMICVFTLQNHLRTPSPPGGWSLLASAATGTGVYVYTRTATEIEPAAYTFACTGGSTRLTLACVSVRNWSSISVSPWKHSFTDAGQTILDTDTATGYSNGVSIGVMVTEPGTGGGLATPRFGGTILQQTSIPLSELALTAQTSTVPVTGPAGIEWDRGTVIPSSLLISIGP